MNPYINIKITAHRDKNEQFFLSSRWKKMNLILYL